MALMTPEEEAARQYSVPSKVNQKPKAPQGGNTSMQPGMGPGLTNAAVGVGGQIAANQAARALGGGSGPGWTQGAAGAAAGMGINMAGNYAANKLKPKEEMPTIPELHSGLGLANYGRRFEGAGPGLAGGAARGATIGANPALLAATGGASAGIGALAGLIAGAATKNATSAYSDYSAKDANKIIGDAYNSYLGRPGSQEEIMAQMVGQGYNAGRGDRWVGEKGLYSVLDSIYNSPEAQAFRSGVPQSGQSTNPQSSNSSGPSQSSLPSAGAQPSQGVKPPSGNTTSPTGPVATYNSLYTPENWTPNGGVNGQPKIESTPTSPASPPSLGQYALEGFDPTKLSSGHSSPKYQIGRVLSQFDPRQGLTPELLNQLNALGIGTFSGQRDKLHVEGGDPRFNGLSNFDVVRDFEGNGGWQFSDDTPGQNTSTATSMGYNSPQQFSVPQLSGTSYGDSILRYLMSQLALDSAATQAS